MTDNNQTPTGAAFKSIGSLIDRPLPTTIFKAMKFCFQDNPSIDGPVFAFMKAMTLTIGLCSIFAM
jgi:hypothetical protein